MRALNVGGGSERRTLREGPSSKRWGRVRASNVGGGSELRTLGEGPSSERWGEGPSSEGWGRVRPPNVGGGSELLCRTILGIFALETFMFNPVL